MINNPLAKAVPGMKSSVGFLTKFKRLFMVFFFGIILINTIVIIAQEKDIEPGFEYLGNKFLFSTKMLYDESNKIIDQGGIYSTDMSFFESSWELIKSLWNFMSAFFIIFMWLKILAWFCREVILGDSAKNGPSFTMALIFFLLFQIAVAANSDNYEMMMPINAFVDFVKAIPYVVSPLAEIADNFVDEVNLTNSS